MRALAVSLLSLALLPLAGGCAALGLEDEPQGDGGVAGVRPPEDAPPGSPERRAMEAWLSTWPERPRLAANQMLVRYGMPDEASEQTLVWRDRGPFRRIELSRTEVPHDFPKPHMDFLAHTIRYRVPTDKADDLFEFDGSVIIDRTAGELTAKCDSEAHNVLALNLAHDVVTGARSVAEARDAMADLVVEHLSGESPGALKALQFDPTGEGAADADRVTLEGAALRASAENRALGERPDTGRHGETLAFLLAIHEHEVLAAEQAAAKDVSPRVKEFARTLHEDHGRGAVETMQLGKRAGVPTVQTEAVERMVRRGTAELADLVLLDGPAYERAFLDAMVRGHQEAISLLDDRISNVEDAEVRDHLAAARGVIRRHLDEARRLLGNAESRG